MKKLFLTGIAVLFLATGTADTKLYEEPSHATKDCRPFGYQTCSINGRCLNWCGKWEGP